MSTKSLRIMSVIGAAILIAGVGLIVFVATNWQPASSAPGGWLAATIATVVVGFAVALAAATMLARRQHAKTRSGN